MRPGGAKRVGEATEPDVTVRALRSTGGARTFAAALGSPECATHASRCTLAREKAGMQMVM